MNQLRNKWRRRGAIALSVLVIMIAGAQYWMRVVEPRSAVNTALEWSRLAKLPANVRDLQVETRGNPFSRWIRLSFVASKPELDSWMHNSPGIADATIAESNGVITYTIRPGAGAQSAKVTIGTRDGLVVIFAEWT